MRRALLALALVLLIAPTALASTPPPPPRNSVWNVLTTVDMDVRDNYAVVKVIADITNRGPDPEFPFRVEIPDDAFVTGLTIERDRKVYEATIQPREQAREQYEAWKAQEQTGGLVEKQRHSSTYAYLVNVAEWTDVRATLTYERYLAADRGVYNLSVDAPVSGFGNDLGAAFHARVANTNGVTALWSTPGANAVKQSDGSYTLDWSVGPRPSDASTPFTLSYSLPATDGAGTLTTSTWNGTHYFVHRFRAPADAAHMPVDLVLVLDISGSMSGLKFQQMQDSAKQVVQQLRPEDRLHLAFFSNDASAPWTGLRDMNSAGRKAAATEIEDALIAGGTNLESAIRHGFDALSGIDWKSEEGRLPVLLILTDGEATVGNTDRAQLRALAKTANTHAVNVFTIAFGADADWGFVHGLAQDGNGIALRVPEGAGAEVDLSHFMTLITAPVLKNVRVTYTSDADAYRADAPVLFAGSELIIIGTYDAAKGPLKATVKARAPDGERSYEITASEGRSTFAPRLVAYHQILRYQDLIDAEGERDDWSKPLTKLALRHGFVTDYTSLVVTLDPRTTPTPQDECANCSNVMLLDAQSAPSNGAAWDTGARATSGPSNSMPIASTTSARPGTTATTTASTPTSTIDAHARTSQTAKVPAPGAAIALAALAAVAIALAGAKKRRE